MISTIHTNEKFKQELCFDEFNLIVTAIKLSNNNRYKRIIRFSHVVRDKETKKMTDTIRTCLFFDDYMAIRDMYIRLLYDEPWLNYCLDKMEPFTDQMLERDTKFYEELDLKKGQKNE